MEWISSLQFEPFRAWFFVFRTDDYREFASICVLGGFVTAVLFGAERRSTQREKDIRHEKTHISVRLGSSFCFVRVCDFDYSLVVCTDFGCDRHGCNTCLRKMGRQLLSSGNGGHNAEKAARLFVA